MSDEPLLGAAKKQEIAGISVIPKKLESDRQFRTVLA